MGTGLLLNLGVEACREAGGRVVSFFAVVVLRPEDGPGVEGGSFGSAEVEVEVGMGAFVISTSLGSSSAENVAASDADASADTLVGRDGTLTSFSPVDFLDGGGPRMLSP